MRQLPLNMPSTNPASKKSQPGQLEELLNSDDSWTIRKVDSKSRTPIISGIGGTVYGIRSAKTTNVETQFQKNVKKVWSSPSITGDNKPYVWINLTDSNSKKYIKKNDSRTFPIGSVVQDVKRMSKMMTSRSGVFFAITQLALQQQNAFNETRIWNPLSIITATARPGSLGLLSYPTRHIEGAGGGFLGNIVAGFMSSVGLQSAKAKAKVPGIAKGAENLDSAGTPTSAISLQASQGSGMVQKGFIRGETGNKARNLFTEKWNAGNWGEGGSKTDGKSGFLSKLGSALTEKLKSFIPSTTGRSSANWQIRAEYTDDKDKNVFSALLKSDGMLGYTVKNIKNKTGVNYKVTDIHIHTGETGHIYSSTPGQPNPLDFRDLKFLQSSLSDGSFRPNENIGLTGFAGAGNLIGNKRDDRDFSNETKQSINNILNGTPDGNSDTTTYDANIAAAIRRWHDMSSYSVGIDPSIFYTNGQLTYTNRSKMSTSDKKYGKLKGDKILEGKSLFGGAQRPDGYNKQGIVDDVTWLSGDDNGSTDTIFFYFHDLINEKYIPFRATLTGISENTSVNWEDVQYMGRADKLFTYNGFSRELNFGFTVYANSVQELIPMWTRINYLSGLTRPSKYTDGSGALSGFIYPPLIKFRVGDMYIDQPAVIASFGLTIPDDATWETTRQQDSSTYKYLVGTHQEISVGKVQTRQLPMKVDISVSMRLLEKELSKTGNNLYFNPIDLGLSPSGIVQNQPSTTATPSVTSGMNSRIDNITNTSFDSTFAPFDAPFTPSTEINSYSK